MYFGRSIFFVFCIISYSFCKTVVTLLGFVLGYLLLLKNVFDSVFVCKLYSATSARPRTIVYLVVQNNAVFRFVVVCVSL